MSRMRGKWYNRSGDASPSMYSGNLRRMAGRRASGTNGSASALSGPCVERKKTVHIFPPTTIQAETSA